MNIEEFNLVINEKKMQDVINRTSERSKELKDKSLFQKIFSLIDLTSLDVADNDEKISSMVSKVNELPNKFPDLPNIAAICVFPNFIPLVREKLNTTDVKLASVGASFPSSQSFFDIKLKEVERALEEGADEIDVVLSVGKFNNKKYDEVYRELKEIKSVVGDKHLKVILEVSALKSFADVKLASLISLEAGADFIKTSTGKNGPGASPEAVYIMAEAIKEFIGKTGKTPGIKPAGGISDATTAVHYYLIVNEILGNEWTKPSRFRIGASRLANNLLGETYF